MINLMIDLLELDSNHDLNHEIVLRITRYKVCDKVVNLVKSSADLERHSLALT